MGGIRRAMGNCVSGIGRRHRLDSRRLHVVNDVEEFRWIAIINRDRSVAGTFVYGVTSTGIYCRSGCPSRRPLRRNVVFFATPAGAAEAGFRPCQRCRPELVVAPDPGVDAVVELCRRLEDSREPVDVATFAADRGYSERHLRRRFTQLIGVPVATYARIARDQHVRRSLRSRVPVTQAIVDAGYGSSRAFYEHGAARLGMPPSRYRDGARGEQVTFTSLDTPLGTVVVAATSRGVCAVRIGDDETALVDELRHEFPLASLVRGDEELEEVAHVLAGAVRGEANASRLPIDLEGTAFQMRVWDVLRHVPLGETLTYSQLAERTGTPRAVRAVASACAANPAALVVPCHRIIRRDGTLGGYRWGLDAKAALLENERATVAGVRP